MGAGKGALGSRRLPEYMAMGEEDLEREINTALAQITGASHSLASSSSSPQPSSSGASNVNEEQRFIELYDLHAMSEAAIADAILRLMLLCVNVTGEGESSILQFIRRVRRFIKFTSHIPPRRLAQVRDALSKVPSTDALASLLFFRATPKKNYWQHNQLIPLQLATCEGTYMLFNIPMEEFFAHAFFRWSKTPTAGIRYIEPFIDIEGGRIPTDEFDRNQQLASIKQQEDSRRAVTDWITWCTTRNMRQQLRHDTPLALFVVQHLGTDVEGSSQLLHSVLQLVRTNISATDQAGRAKSILLNFTNNAANHHQAPPPEMLWCMYPDIFRRGPIPYTVPETVRALTSGIRCGISSERFVRLLPADADLNGLSRFNLCLNAARYGRVDLLQTLSVPLLFRNLDALMATQRLVKLLDSTRMDVERPVIELTGLAKPIVDAALEEIAERESYDDIADV